MRHPRGSLFVTLVVTAVVLVAFANPATASEPTVRSGLGAGYLVAPAGGVTTASMTFLTPSSVTCVDHTDLEAMFFGLILRPANPAELSDVGASMICGSGGFPPSISYFAHTAHGGFSPGLTGVLPGDRLLVTAAADGITLKLTIRDLRTGMSVSNEQKSKKPPNVLFGAIGTDTIPTFKTQGFAGAKVNGLDVGVATPRAREVLQHASTVQIATSLVHPSGTSFTLTWKSNT
jgi:hypothetical protein